jgi:hypothetical protein
MFITIDEFGQIWKEPFVVYLEHYRNVHMENWGQ